MTNNVTPHRTPGTPGEEVTDLATVEEEEMEEVPVNVEGDYDLVLHTEGSLPKPSGSIPPHSKHPLSLISVQRQTNFTPSSAWLTLNCSS